MTKTTNYQLNQWAKSDRIRMDDFNADNAKIDAALKANADAIAETAAAFPLVKIKEVTLGSSTAAYTLDVSDVDFTQYHRIELYCSAAYSDLRVTVRVNGQSSGYHSGAISGGGTGSTATALGYLGGGTMLFYEPKAGDIIFFDWSNDGQDGDADHVGIVEKCENGVVYTVEGNSGDACRQNSYLVGYYEILGYGCPSY